MCRSRCCALHPPLPAAFALALGGRCTAAQQEHASASSSCITLPTSMPTQLTPPPQEEERLELFNRHVRSGAATPFDVPLPYTGASGHEGAADVSAPPLPPQPLLLQCPPSSRACAQPAWAARQLRCGQGSTQSAGLPQPATPSAAPSHTTPAPWGSIPSCNDQAAALEVATPMTPKSASSASSDSTDLEDDPDVAVVEMLMEPYFMQARRWGWGLGAGLRRTALQGCMRRLVLFASQHLLICSPVPRPQRRSTTPTTSCRRCASTSTTPRTTSTSSWTRTATRSSGWVAGWPAQQVGCACAHWRYQRQHQQAGRQAAGQPGSQSASAQHTGRRRIPSPNLRAAPSYPLAHPQLDLVLTSFNAAVALVTAITGLFAMNVMLLPDKASSRGAAGPGPPAGERALAVPPGCRRLPACQGSRSDGSAEHATPCGAPRLSPCPAGGPGALLLVPGRQHLHRRGRHLRVRGRDGLLPLAAPDLSAERGALQPSPPSAVRACPHAPPLMHRCRRLAAAHRAPPSRWSAAVSVRPPAADDPYPYPFRSSCPHLSPLLLTYLS